MKKIMIMFLTCSALRIFAQASEQEIELCNYGGDISPINSDSLVNLPPLPLLSQIVDSILAVGLLPPKQIKLQHFEARKYAVATILDKERYILFNERLMRFAQSRYNGDWKIRGILAHEIGHHLLGHSIKHNSSFPEIELAADEYAGKILQRLGATLEQAYSCMHLVSKWGSAGYPSREKRIEAVKKGWNLAKETHFISPPVLRQDDFIESATGVSFSMKWIQGNRFEMGGRDREAYSAERPTHQVHLNSFYISQHEVTVGEYLQFCQETNGNAPEWLEKESPRHIETGRDSIYQRMGYKRHGSERLPIVGVNWKDAKDYCNWLSRKTGKAYRLPTEAEWEYAARGGQNYKYAGSDNLNVIAWHISNSNHPQEVGKKHANGFGLYDMSGNVWEWCGDYYGEYGAADQHNPNGVKKSVPENLAVIRGGSFVFEQKTCRVSNRHAEKTWQRKHYLGFRVVCNSR